jgi:nucleoside-diphosphate-sugar epimerase
MSDSVVLITGAGGEVGHGLIGRLSAAGRSVVSIDLQPLAPALAASVTAEYTGSILDEGLLRRVFSEHRVETVFHLAALLSTSAERDPQHAHRVNVDGTLALLEYTRQTGERHGKTVRFLFPSTIAVYGLPSRVAKQQAGRVDEDRFTEPTTMYGCNKLYCEHLGRYYARHYRQGATAGAVPALDFRGVRFPGLLSADTVPSGGTSDYAPEMFHAAAQGKPYACFVGPDTWLPFMAMPDAIDALLQLEQAPQASLSRAIYNVSAFSASAEACARETLVAFPGARITWAPDVRRQGIVDTWPADVDDEAARCDWGFSPAYDFERTFREYLHPAVTARYASHS